MTGKHFEDINKFLNSIYKCIENINIGLSIMNPMLDDSISNYRATKALNIIVSGRHDLMLFKEAFVNLFRNNKELFLELKKEIRKNETTN